MRDGGSDIEPNYRISDMHHRVSIRDGLAGTGKWDRKFGRTAITAAAARTVVRKEELSASCIWIPLLVFNRAPGRKAADI